MSTSVRQVIIDALDAVDASADELNTLDGVAGDGDLGVTVTIAVREVKAALASVDAEDLAALLSLCGRTMVRKAPSTSGTLVGSALLRAARTAHDGRRPDVAELLQAAVEAVMERGGAQPGDKTMVDALLPAMNAAAAARDGGLAAAAQMADAADAAAEGVSETAGMRARHGRAGWLADRSQGHPDGGARLIAIVLRAVSVSLGRPQGGDAPAN